MPELNFDLVCPLETKFPEVVPKCASRVAQHMCANFYVSKPGDV